MSSAAMDPHSISSGRVSSTGSTARTPLSVVPQRTGRRSRVSTVVMCAAALAIALLGILFLNIQISQGQYQLTELTGHQRALSQENEALTQDIEANAAPQNLSARANDLGMVKADQTGSVDLRTGTVVAAPAAAQKGEAEEILIPPAAMKGSEAAEKNRQAAEKRADQRAKDAAAKKEANRKAEQKSQEAAELNGGQLPAPSQRAPGH